MSIIKPVSKTESYFHVINSLRTLAHTTQMHVFSRMRKRASDHAHVLDFEEAQGFCYIFVYTAAKLNFCTNNPQANRSLKEPHVLLSTSDAKRYKN